MLRIATKYFGTLECEETALFYFAEGLPAFEDETLFAPVERAEEAPLLFLQSARRPDLCFLTFPVRVADPIYELAVAPEDLEALDLATDRQPVIGEEALALALLSVAAGRPATANLMAPIVVNLKSRRALQAIRRDQRYSHQHALLKHAEEVSC
jgi:flagellar assembly factor FliW